MQGWLIEMVKKMIGGLPVGLLARMGLATVIAPRTSNWSAASAAIQDYIDEKHDEQRRALKLQADK